MSLTPVEVIEPQLSDGEWHPVHWVCNCNLDLALCGEELEGPILDEVAEEDECIVCEELKDLPCPRCGGRIA